MLIVLGVALVCYLVTISHAFDHVYIASPGRLPDGTVSLDEFLSYGYDHSFTKLLELILAVPSNPDARIFTGYVNVALFVFALLSVRRKAMALFAWGAFLFLLFSLADATILRVPRACTGLVFLPG